MYIIYIYVGGEQERYPRDIQRITNNYEHISEPLHEIQHRTKTIATNFSSALFSVVYSHSLTHITALQPNWLENTTE